jgi:K+-transporting ATPase KdpF subunit
MIAWQILFVILYFTAGVLALGLFVYLFVALVKPELF